MEELRHYLTEELKYYFTKEDNILRKKILFYERR